MVALRLLGLLILLLLTGSSASALTIFPPGPDGCDVYDDDRVSSFDLVLRADAIIVAQAGAPSADRVPMRVSRTLKGRVPDRFDLPLGFVSGGPGGRGDEATCQTWVPHKDQTYLLFLVRGAGGHAQAFHVRVGSVASRYEGAQRGWEPVVRLYLGIQEKQPPETWRPAVETLLLARLRPDADAEEQWQARQFVDYLRTPTRTTPTAALLALLDGVRRGQLPPWGLLLWGDDRPWSDFIADQRPRRAHIPLEEIEERILIALQTGQHPAAADLFRAMGEHPAKISDLSHAVRFFVRQQQRALALDLLERQFRMVTRLPASDRCGFVLGVGADMAGQSGGNPKTEAWRSDPTVVERWPALAFELLRLDDGACVHGQDSAFARAAADYREPLTSRNRQDMLLLASAGSRAVTDWAEAAIDRFVSPKTVTWVDDPRREDAILAFEMLVRRNDPALLMKAAEWGYCNTNSRDMLLAALEAHGTDLSVPARLLASWNPQTEPWQRSALMTMLVRIYGRRPAVIGRYYGAPAGAGGAVPFSLLEDLLAGRPGPGEPFRCPPESKAAGKP